MGFFDPPKAKPLLAADKTDKEYKQMRLKVFLGAFVGWNATFWMLIAASVIAAVFCATTWKSEKLTAME